MMTTTNTATVRETLINEHVAMVQRIAKKMARRCPEWIGSEDLVSAGFVGLVEAADRYDVERAEPFGAFAEYRIRGAMLDELRRGDIMPRRVRQQARKVANAIRDLETSGQDATDEKIAVALGVSVERYRQRLAGLVNVGVDSLDESIVEDRSNASLENQIAHRHMVAKVQKALGSLKSRDAQILVLHFIEERSFAEIGEQLGVTPSRVCQLLRRAVETLRAELDPEGAAVALAA